MMDIRYFAHSWLSDWNNGNAHFLRGLMSALARRGHRVRCYQPAQGWSLAHLLQEPRGPAAMVQARAAYPELAIEEFGLERPDLRGAEVVLVHEWNEPGLVAWLAEQRRRHGFRLLLHDTHHRALSDPAMLDRLPLAAFDAVLAFGESLRQVYEARGARRTYTLHEAADTERFFPRAPAAAPTGVVWIGNWGDEERSGALEEFLLGPVRRSRMAARAYGIRYPAAARRRLQEAGIVYGGYLPNLAAPEAYASAAMTVHVPRQPYADALEGIPTIRVFEALACGAPLLSAPWRDRERLFEAGEDYLPVRDGREMEAWMMQLQAHEEQRMQLSRHGLATIRARHTCAHRAVALEEICRELDCTSTFSVPA